MTTGLTYSQFTSLIATLAVIDSPTNAGYVAILPQLITYAENRIYRDLDFLQTSTSYVTTMTAGSRTLTLPAATFVVSEQINVITPSSQTNPELGTRNPLTPTTKEFLDACYAVGTSSARGQPIYYCPFNDNLFYVGPFPDANYTVELVGTYRPDSLSATNPTTFISLYLPDLMVAAGMVYISGWQRNFQAANSQPDDAAMPVSWETQYMTLLKSAMSEESRKKYEAAAWSSQSPSPIATPTRG